MKQIKFLVVSLLFTNSLNAQEVISSQGDSYTNSNGSIDYTIGEVIIITGSDSNNDLTQGFQQSSWDYLGSEDYAPEIEVKLYPNPTSDELFVDVENFEGMEYEFYDNAGKLVKKGILNSTHTTLSVGEFADGNYVLNIKNNKDLLKTFKLIKQ